MAASAMPATVRHVHLLTDARNDPLDEGEAWARIYYKVAAFSSGKVYCALAEGEGRQFLAPGEGVGPRHLLKGGRACRDDRS